MFDQTYSGDAAIAASQSIKERKYWLEKLSGELVKSSFPYDNNESVSAGSAVSVVSAARNMARLDVYFKDELFSRLITVSNQSDTRLLTVLTAGLMGLLAKYTGSRDIIIGMPIYKQKVTGDFINTVVPLRCQIQENLTFKNLLYQVKQTIDEAVKHQNYPLKTLLYDLNLSFSGHDFPLFDNILIMKNIQDPSYSQHIPVNIEFIFFRISEYLEVTVQYNRLVYDQETIKRILCHFSQLLKAAIFNVDLTLSEIDILTAEEKKQLLCEFNQFNSTQTGRQDDLNKTLYGLFAEQVEKTPDETSLIFIQQDQYPVLLTYRQLDEKAGELAFILKEKGFGARQIAALLIESSLHMATAVLAVLKAGGAYLPIDVEAPQDRKMFTLKDSGVQLLLTGSAVFYTGIEDLQQLDISVEFLYTHNTHKKEHAHDHEMEACTPGNPAYVIYTSGSTGRPKGVIVEHRQAVNTLVCRREEYLLEPGHTALQLFSYAFDGFITSFFTPIISGARVILLSKDTIQDISKIVDVISAFKVTHFISVPVLFQAILTGMTAEESASLQVITLAGDKVQPQLLELAATKNKKIEIVNEYGITEAAVMSTIYRHQEKDWRIKIGRPIGNTSIYILTGNDRQQLAPIGVFGEMCIAGAGVARGYLNNPELTSGRFLRNYRAYGSYMTNILYKTGDLARWLPDGNIEYKGRADFQVKVRGFRVELGEIEKHLITHGDIKECIVMALPNNDGDTYLCAYITVNRQLSAAELREYLAIRLPDYMIPAYFITLAEIPLSPNGKVDRNQLPSPAAAIKASEYTPPRDQFDKRLLEIWAEILGVQKDSTSIDANFFELGGHSLTATLMANRIYKEFNVKIPMVEIFKSPQIRHIIEYIKSAHKNIYTSIEPCEKKDYYKLSSTQERFYILQQMEKESTAYNLPLVIELEGELTKSAFENAFRQLIQRHENLRTSFCLVEGKPVARVHQPHEVEFNIEYYELAKEEKNDQGKIQSIIEKFVRFFDLSHVPLLRAGLIRLNSKKYILMADMHHILTDIVAYNILTTNFLALYFGQELKPLKLQYKDYSEWQKSNENIELLIKQEKYWLKQFEGESATLELPIDFPRPGVQSFAGNTIDFELPVGQCASLFRLANSQQTTIFMVLLTIFNILLSKICNQEEIIVGTPIVGRKHVDFEEIIGAFINMLPLKNSIKGEHTFIELLNVLKENTIEAFDNQDYTYENLVEKVVTVRDISRNHLFDVLFAMQNIFQGSGNISETQMQSLIIKPFSYSSKTSKFDLSLFAFESKDQITFAFEYCTKLFNEDTILRFINYFKKITISVLVDPQRKIFGVEILTDEEKNRILDEFNNTYMEYPKEKVVHQLFVEQVERTPNNTALIFEREQLTYSELDKNVNQVARYLRARGTKPDDIIGLMAERSFELVIGTLAIVTAGSAYLPIDSELSVERKKYFLENSIVKMILINYTMDNETRAALGDVEYIDLRSKNIYTGESTNLNIINQTTDLLYVIYTSGSTGKPKGVMLEHRNLVNLLIYTLKHINIDFSAILQFSNISFDIFFQEIFCTLLSGGKLCLIDREKRLDIPKLFAEILKNQLKTSFLPMSMLKIIFNEGGYSDIFPRCIKHIWVAGEQVILSDIFRNFLQNNCSYLYNLYGPSETYVVTTLTLDPTQEIPSLPTIGKPIANTFIYILDQYKQVLPIRVAGELYVGGIAVGRGYIGEKTLNEEKFIPNPFINGDRLYRTGDLAKWQENGNIEFLGRLDYQVKIRGFRVECGEIENQLLIHPEIKEVVVVPKENEKGDKYLCAYFVAQKNHALLEQELRVYLSSKLPDYMIPTYFIPIDHVPLTSSGKINRRALPTPTPTMQRKKLFIEPVDKIEKILACIWQEELKLEKISIDDNFFHLGGHSLKAITMCAKANKELNVRMSIIDVFKNPTIKGLAERISNLAADKFTIIEPAEKKEYYALAPAQERLYFLQQIDAGGITYNLPNILALEEKIDEQKLAEVFKKLIARHESLRTSIEIKAGKPVQRIHRNVEFEIGHYDVADLADMEKIIGHFVAPFNFGLAPLLRVSLVNINRHDNTKAFAGIYPQQIMLFDIHHIIADGISQNILIREFMELYAGKELLPLTLRYRDYSEWQLWSRAQNMYKQQADYWLNLFTGEIPVIDISYDYPRPALQSFTGSVFMFGIGEVQTKALKEIARSYDVTLFMMLLALYNIFLLKLSRQEDIIVGSPVAGRRHADLQQIIGMFVNTLALRNYPSGEKTFPCFLKEIRENTLVAFDNQDYQFEDLVEQVAISRDTSRNPLFDTMFVLQNIEIAEINISDMKLSPYPYENKTAKFDLTLTAVEVEEKLLFNFEYSTKLFREETINRFIGYFKNIVIGVSLNKDKRIADIEIITEEDKKRILIDFNNTEAEYPRDKTMHQLFAEQAAQTPDAIALVARETREKHEKQITYFELNEQSNRLAGLLIEKGVQPDNIVGIMMERSVEMIIGIMGILKAGGAYLPINPKNPLERINYLLRDSGAKLLAVANESEGEKLRSWEGEKVLLESICHLSNYFSYRHSAFDIPRIHHSNHLAYLIYTSGSTGNPKGVPITHTNLCPLLHWGYKRLGIEPKDKALQNVSYYFDWSVWEIFITLTTGAVLCMVSDELALNPGEGIPFMKKNDITILHVTPTQYLHFIGGGDKLETLKYLFLGAEKLTVDLLRRSFASVKEECRIFNMYGPTEATIISAVLEIKRGDESRFENLSGVPIGRPVANGSLLVLDKYLNLNPVNVTGELYIGGAGLARGYLNNPELTAERFNKNVISHLSLVISKFQKYENPSNLPIYQCPMTNDRFYHTGDLARWLPDGPPAEGATKGIIEFLGRIDQQIKIRGFRIELGEIENQLLKHKYIKEAVVVINEDAIKDKNLTAYIISSEELLEIELREYLQEKLPEYMIPSHFVQLEKIPLTPNGKLDRKALPKPELKAGECYIAPRNEIEKKLVEIWSEVLGQTAIGIDDNFFHLGGHSLKATILVSKIHKVFQVIIPLAEIFKTPTIRNLSNYIKASVKEKYRSIEPVEKKEYYSLSSAQKRLYILYQMDLQGVGYNIPSFLVLEGEIDKEKLEHTFRQLIHRHESLRTSFLMINDEPVQRIHDQVEFEVEYLAAKNANEREDGRGVPPWSPFIRPFNLSQAPLLRVGLLKEKENRHILMVDMHHIISDGTSINVLVKDFMALYQSKYLSEIRFQYKDFSNWQKNEKQAESLKRQEEYWLKEFAGEIPVLELPVDYPRPAVQSFEGNRILFEIDKESTGVLKTLALELGATMYMILLSLYTVFLAKVTNEEDIVIGSPIAGRRHVDLETIIGMFVNTLALRNYPSGEKRFPAFLNEVKEKTLKAFENQDYQYEDLVERVVIGRDTSRNPLFDTMLVLQNIEIAEINISGLKLSPYPYENKTAKFDLTLTAVEAEEKLVFDFEYSTKLFKEETANRFIIYFKNVIKSIIENQERRISDIEIINEEEKKQILVDFNDTAAEYPKDKTIHQLFAEQAAQTPDAIALVACETREKHESFSILSVQSVPSIRLVSLSYSELDEQSDRMAGLLIEKGVLPDTVVGIMMERSIEMIIGILGILKAGGAYLPIDPDYPQERIDYMLKDSNAKVLLINKSEIRNPKLETNPNDPNLNDQNKNQNSGAALVLNFENLNFEFVCTRDFVLSASNLFSSNLAYVIYTSGTTGKPKGSLIEHHSLVNRLNWMQKAYPLDERDTILQKTTFTFDVSVWEIFWWSMTGARLCLLSPGGEKDPESITQAIEKNHITTMHFVPSMLSVFLDYLEREQKRGQAKKLATLKQVIASGEALLPAHVELFIHLLTETNGTLLSNLYGPTEATIDVSYFNCLPGKSEREIIPIGKPIDNINLYILDRGSHLQPIGIPGELCIGGVGLARGYLNRPELTTEKFIFSSNFLTSSLPNFPLYHTGDLARWLTDGNIEFLGRIDHQVKIRGFRIELGEIENQLLKHKYIKEAVVVINEDAIKNKNLTAYFISTEGLIESELREYLQQNLPDYMIPSHFVRLEKIQLTPNGKLDRKALPKPEVKTGENYTAPRDEIETKLVELWAGILGSDEAHASQLQTSIGIDDNFFQLGGHSLKATILILRIHKELNVRVPLAEIFRAPVIRELAKYIREKNKEFHIAIEPVEKREYYALSSAQKRLYFLQQLELSSTSYNMPLVLPIGKEINKDKLEFALKQLIVRHESLRTSFQRLNNEVVQEVHESVAFEIEYFNLATEHTEVTEKLGDRQEKTPLTEVLGGQGTLFQKGSLPPEAIIKNFIRPFDLSQAPLMRSGLIEMPDENHIWVVDIHHIVSDGTSHAVLTEDFMRLYETGVPLEPLPIQYKDFAQWQNLLFAEGRIKSQEDYWLQLYAGEIPRLNVAADYKRPGVFTFAGDQYRFLLAGEEAGKFKTLGARYGGTLYMNMMAVLNTMFYKYTGQADIIIGSGIAGRRHADIQGVVGMFVNTLVMRNYPSGEKTYEHFLKEVIANSVAGFENQDVQFEELVEKLEPERDPSRNPLFDISMVVQNFRQAQGNIQLEIKNENNSTRLYKNRTAKFDLTFFVSELEKDVDINIEYYTGIFKKETIQRLVNHFQNIIKAVIENPAIAIKDIDILSEKEKEQLLYEFNDTGAIYPKDKTIHGLIEEQVARTPDYVAMIYKDQMVTYRELDCQANQLARYLYEEKKIRTGEPVGVWMLQPVYRQVALVGVLKAGGAFVPLDPAIPTKRMKYIIDDSRTGVVISDKHHLRDLNRLQWECAHLHSYLCCDSVDIYAEEEQETNQLMDQELWHHVGESAVDEITGGGWLSSYTGLPFSRAEMDEYGANIFNKLEPLLHPGMKVLEIGCASGISMFRLAPKVGLYYGTDLSAVIIEKNKKVVQEKGIRNIELSCLPAHEIDKIPVNDFDLVIINSVIQCFHGHNYLRHVLQKAVSLLKDNGYLFIGDVMDQEKENALVREMTAFKEANRDKGYTTKTDFSAELFVSKGFWHDLQTQWREIKTVNCSAKQYSIENELTKFRYDALLEIEKTNINDKNRPKFKYQDDMRFVSLYEGSRVGLNITTGNLAYIIYTSGSTGQPKGVMVEHRSLVNVCHWHNTYYSFTSRDRATRYAGFGFDATICEFFPSLLVGAAICIIPEEIKLDVGALNHYYEKNGVTLSFLPPQMAELFMTIDNKSLRFLEAAGDRLTTFIKRNYQLVNCYGPTEDTVCTTAYPVMEMSDNIPIGKPVSNNQVYIMDKDNNLQPVGVAGELCIGGDGVARGYLNNPELTAEKIIKNRFYKTYKTYILYHTGDLARYLADGNIEYLGRIDQQVKIRGFRIELGEIESRLSKHVDIKQAVVLIQEEEKGDKYLVAYVVSGAENVTKELREYLAKELPDYMIPSYFVQVEKIPLTANGKIDRKALPKPGLIAGESYTAPRDEIETKLVELWAGILGSDEAHASQLQTSIGIDDNFFALGGHSLKATILVSKVHKVFDVKISLVEIFKAPTIREMARITSGKTKDKFTPISTAEKKEYYPVSSAQKRLFVVHIMDGAHATNYNMPHVFTIKGPLDISRVELAFKRLIQRHESLRTSFTIIGNNPVQRIHDEVEFEIEYLAMDTLPQHGQTRTPGGSALLTFIRPFDLSRAPLLRMALLKTGDDNHVVIFDMHHIIADGRGFSILVKEFTALYRGEILPPLKIQYKDFAQWQNWLSTTENMEKQKIYWLNRFTDEIPLLNFPTDFSRQATRTTKGKIIVSHLPGTITNKIKKLNLETETTLYIVLLAAYNILLAKYTLQEDIVIGSPIGGRKHADLHPIIGTFANMLAMRNFPAEHKSFGDFLMEVKENAFNAYENQDYQFEELVAERGIKAIPGRNPLFDTVLNMVNIEQEKNALQIDDRLEILPYEFESNAAKYDLLIRVYENENRVNISLEYATSLFKFETAKNILEHFIAVLEHAVENKEQKIQDITIKADFQPVKNPIKDEIDFNF